MDPASAASLTLGAVLVAVGAVAIGLLIASVWLLFLSRRLRSRLSSEEAESARLREENVRLRPFSDVADAADEAARIRRDATAAARKVVDDASEEARSALEAAAADIDAAKAAADGIREETRAYKHAQKQKADALLATAGANATRIVEEAREQAHEIAGDALVAMENASRWEATEKAMRNIVKGYGDAYMKPPHGVLDDLADDYDHKEAGQELKMARKRSKLMVTEGRAATCDYVEKYRRETAIRFVTDAFNGKVDALLAKAKSTNVGTLEQKVRDAFALVNHNGAAFRKARITPEYLASRLAELKWATAAFVLREQEREEQRAIKAQLREEARAQREFERARREAAKEQAALQKAFRKAQKMLSEARQEEREQYEAQLIELQRKLGEAEEKNQRAISMAQLTRSGHVYIISNVGSFGEGVFKIGLTRRLEPLDRVRELGDASVPFRFDVHALIYSEDAPRLERALHHRFALNQVNKVNPRKEFFAVDLRDIRAAVEELGLAVHWTLHAQALEYRESQSLDEALKSDEEVRASWLARQARWEAYLESVSDDPGAEDDVALDEMPPLEGQENAPAA